MSGDAQKGSEIASAEEILATSDALGFGTKDIDDPRFEEAGRVHDWRNHVPEGLEQIWPRLNRETRAAVFVMASALADREEWD